MSEDPSPAARLLLERLSRYVDGEEAPGSGDPIEVGLCIDLSSLAFGGSPVAGEEIELAEAWFAIEGMRRRIEAADHFESGSRAVRHARLDAAALGIARAAADATAEAHRQLIQDISHDIRSPLNSILFLADALLTAPGGSLPPVQRRQASVLYGAAVALVRLVNDVIDAARLGAGPKMTVQHSRFLVREAWDDVAQLVAPLADHRGITLEFEGGGTGVRVGDRQLFCRVLINLVSNAIEAASQNGIVRVSLTAAAPDRLVACVSDDGVGTDIEELQRLIGADSVLYPRRRVQGWTRGLGLALCGRLVRAAEGDLSIERLPDGVTRFTVHLPFPEAE